MEMKISVKRNPEISFTFDNQKRDPSIKEKSKLQAKVTIKCQQIKKLTLGPIQSQPQTILLELTTEAIPSFSKQTRSNASVKKPKWTPVTDTKGIIKI